MMMSKKKLTEHQKKVRKAKRLETLRIRYAVYRDAGYTAKEARSLRFKDLDVSKVKTDKQGKVIKKTNYKRAIGDVKVNIYVSDVKKIKNDTVYSKWGMLSQDDRYKDDTARIVKHLQLKHKLSNDQAYYFIYTMLQGNMTYTEAKRQLLTNKEFEMYDKKKRGK